MQHFTVGRDSYSLIKNQGLAAFLLPKVGVPWQFAEADAVTAHACEWNRLGAGLEFERMNWNEPLTDDQIKWGGHIVRWFADNYGIPLVLHDGARLPIGSPFRGSVNHGSLVHRACDQHTDGITQDDFARMVGGAGGDDDVKGVLFTITGGKGPAGPGAIYHAAGNTYTWVTHPDAIPVLKVLGQVLPDVIDLSPEKVAGWTYYPPDTSSKVITFLRSLFPKRSAGK